MRQLTGFIGLLMLIAANPATRPTTLPSGFVDTPEYRTIKNKIDLATEGLAGSRASVVSATTQSAEYKAAENAIVELSRRRQEAERSGTAQQKLDAWLALLNSKGVLNTLREKAIKTSNEVATAENALMTARTELEAATDAYVRTRELERIRQEELDARDPIKIAIKEHRLVVGMTLDQADEAMKRFDRKLVLQDADGTEMYDWAYAGSSVWSATTRKGKITRVIKYKESSGGVWVQP